uniref:Glucosylceramidase n=1 Tax=Timema poppense TaxID=170557 RepID=A0A7R9CFN1_TIMPO|nr:unnamed protein product [Timema poppensis]
MDWNMKVAPNWFNNMVDSPIIVNARADDFYKQPMLYALTHVPKFVPPGSVRVDLDSDDDYRIEHVAFLTPDVSVVVILNSISAQDCVPRDYGKGSIVCVCNATYCDYVEPTTTEQLTGNVVRHYVSAKDGRRLEPMTMEFENVVEQEDIATFHVSRDVTYQEIIGFGGADTDATGINLLALSEDSQDNLLSAYFSDKGIRYTTIRVPVGGSDFSDHYYAYDDDHPNDVNLEYFNLTKEDYVYKIPLIKRAQELSPVPVKLFSSPWSAPDWMKTIDTTTKASSLKKEYYGVYANYYVRFLDEYAAENLEFWGLTTQNEPGHGLTYGSWNSMGWYPEQLLDWVVGYLGPALEEGGYSHLKLMINDDQRINVPDFVKIYENTSLNHYASGMAVHWYFDSASADILTQAHDDYPDKFILYTEACITRGSTEPAVTLGSWENGEKYLSDVIEVTNHWVTGWTDWNMALDLEGGPNWANNTVDAPIIVNATADEFYKQPMFYALAHVTKFVPPGSVRIGLETDNDNGIENVAFVTPDNVTVIILLNREDTVLQAVISDPVKVEEDTITFSVNRDITYQDVYGFGGADTDATGVNKRSLSEDAGDKLIRAYFSPEGIGYTIIRVPVGGSDFSTHFYTYDDDHKDDMDLKFFNLTEEDYTLKIPLIKRAQELSPIPIRLFSSPWSAPDWMKDINDTTKASRLDEQYYEVYANYYVSFLDAYAEQNVEFWGLTPQNEPDHGLEYGFFNSMGWYPSEMLEWIVGYLGPALDAAGYGDLKMMINDHQRTMIAKWAELYKNESLSKFVSGMAVHWYTDQDSDPKILTQFHDEYPEKFLLYTEACDMNNWVTGWTDWNMALDLEGGPNWVSNYVDAPIIVNATADEFYKQPMFYALAHFSKFVPPGSVHIGLDTDDDTGIENIAFLTPDNVTVVILQNRESHDACIQKLIVVACNGATV